MEILIGIIRKVGEHTREDWPAALFVTAIVTIVHLNLGWFDSIDRFAYMVLTHLSSRNVKEAPDILLVGIDEVTHAARYFDRSPLDRCLLKRHVGLIYSSGPRLFVVDLDLSPALWIQQAPKKETGIQKACQDDLYRLIERNGHKTVLMAPFTVPKLEAAALKLQLLKQDEWMAKMKEKGVRFGSGELPVENGIVYKTSTGTSSLSYVALCKAGEISQGRTNSESSGFTSKPVINICKKEKDKARPIFLDFRQSIGQVDLHELESLSSESMRMHIFDKTVFFGAKYGEQDRFLTLKSEMYGVEVHALGYASAIKGEGQGIDFLNEHNGHIIKLVVDLVVAFLMGTLITYIWRRYFEFHSSNSKLARQRAFLMVLFLGILVVTALYLCLRGSLLLLTHAGIWLSPVPIAIGMLIESFASSSVAEALRRNPSQPPDRSFKEFFWYGWRNEMRSREPFAGLMILFRRLLWSAVVGYALLLVFVLEHDK